MGAGHGIGIKRNDYHRRNRKANISMHCHSHGKNYPVADDYIIRITIDALIKEATADARYRLGLAPDRIETKRACVNYLRHHASSYLEQLKARQCEGRHADYLSISEQFFQEVSEIYPWLSGECAKQLAARRLMASRTKVIKKINRKQPSNNFELIMPERELTDDEYSAAMACSLKFEATIYSPPFLTRDEIKARRFTDSYGEMNDRWWEWDREKKAEREQERFKWVA